MIRKGQPRVLPWSWERTPGWRGQLARMKRWRARWISQCGTADTESLFDTMLAFFIACYHVRDWLERSGDVSADRLDALFRTSWPLRVCADIANIAKHFDLTRPPRMTRQLSLAREYREASEGWFGADAAIVIMADDNVCDAMALAARCGAAWEAFLQDERLPEN